MTSRPMRPGARTPDESRPRRKPSRLPAALEREAWFRMGWLAHYEALHPPKPGQQIDPLPACDRKSEVS